MAVFTKLTKNDLEGILGEFDIGDLVSFKGIEQGVENTNYFVTTSKDTFVLTIYEKRVKVEDLPFFLNLQIRLNKLGFECPVSVENKKGEIIGNFGKKKYSIITFLQGKPISKTGNEEVKEAGKTLAEMHKLSAEIPHKELYRENSMESSFWKDTYSKVEKETKVKFKYISQIIDEAFDKVSVGWPEENEIECGIIHGDYFPDNVFIKDGKASGVIDFYMACNDFYLYDLAIAMNSWCFEKDYSFNITKAKIFLKSYNSVREFSRVELEYLPILCVGASLRFLSTRLYDYFNTEENAIVKVKDPKEYMEKLKFHMQVKSHTEYGI